MEGVKDAQAQMNLFQTGNNLDICIICGRVYPRSADLVFYFRLGLTVMLKSIANRIVPELSERLLFF